MLFAGLALALLLAATVASWRGKRRCLEVRSHRGARRLLIRTYRPKHRWDVASVAVSLELGRDLPDGTEVRDIAGLPRVRVERGLLRIEAAEDRLRLYPRWLARWRLEGSGLRGRWLTLAADVPVSESTRLVRDLEALADALEEAAAGDWLQQARVLGLQWDGSAMHGTVEGLRVRIAREGHYTDIRVVVPPGLSAVSGRGRTGNPVQDMFIRANQALSPSTTPALLAVLHAHPASSIHAGELRMRLPGPLEDLMPKLQAALNLAHALHLELSHSEAC